VGIGAIRCRAGEVPRRHRAAQTILRGPGGDSNRKATNSVTSKESNSPDMIKDILKFRINPTDIRVGINSLKTLRNGKVQIETGNKEDIGILTKNIHDKCGNKLEVLVHKLRNPRIVIYNVPEDISTQNVEEKS
jgi:hypothetical protein